jgi:hypothetical protein
MDVNVVVVVCFNTGRLTPLRQRIWLNLRLDSFSRPNARRQGLCAAALEKRVFAPSGKGFLISGIYSQRNRAGNVC